MEKEVQSEGSGFESPAELFAAWLVCLTQLFFCSEMLCFVLIGQLDLWNLFGRCIYCQWAAWAWGRLSATACGQCFSLILPITKVAKPVRVLLSLLCMNISGGYSESAYHLFSAREDGPNSLDWINLVACVFSHFSSVLLMQKGRRGDGSSR